MKNISTSHRIPIELDHGGVIENFPVVFLFKNEFRMITLLDFLLLSRSRGDMKSYLGLAFERISIW